MNDPFALDLTIILLLLGVGAAMEGNWGTMVLLFALGGGLMLVFQAIGL